jgi:hypothetical protein
MAINHHINHQWKCKPSWFVRFLFSKRIDYDSEAENVALRTVEVVIVLGIFGRYQVETNQRSSSKVKSVNMTIDPQRKSSD